MYVVFYRWKLKPGSEESFAKYWEEGTHLFRNEQKALGSRLHKADDGTYFAYAQWPDRETYHAKKTLSQKHRIILNEMSECVLESYPSILGDVQRDLLLNQNAKE